jgi:DNA-binding transcriptional MerR regulator
LNNLLKNRLPADRAIALAFADGKDILKVYLVYRGRQQLEWLKIDDVAKETGLTKRSIRYYEEIGLMKSPERSDGGIRLYTEEDVQQLKNIVLAKKVLGFSLQEIQEFLQIHDQVIRHRSNASSSSDEALRQAELENMAEAVSKQLKLVDYKIKEMIKVREELAGLSGRINKAMQN